MPDVYDSPDLADLVSQHPWRTLRAIAQAHHQRFDIRWRKDEAVAALTVLLSDPRVLTRALRTLPDEAQEALRVLQLNGGVLPAVNFLARFGPLRPYTPWRVEETPTPEDATLSVAERLWFLGLLFRVSHPTGDAIIVPAAVLRLLPPLPQPIPHLATPASLPDLPDLVWDVAQWLAYTHAHPVRLLPGGWMAPRHYRWINQTLRAPDPLATHAPSELRTGYLRFLHYLAESAGFVAPAWGNLALTPAAWGWLDADDAHQQRILAGGWRNDLQRAPGAATLWTHHRWPGAPGFVLAVLGSLPALPSGWYTRAEWELYLEADCLHNNAFPPDGDIATPLQALLDGPLRWAGWVQFDGTDRYVWTMHALWGLGFAVEPPAASPLVPATVQPRDPETCVLTLPAPPACSPLRSLVALALPWPAADARSASSPALERLLTRAHFAALLSTGQRADWVIEQLRTLTMDTLSPETIAQVREWETQIRQISLRRLTVLSSADTQTLAKLAQMRNLRPHIIETLSPHHVAIAPEGIAALLRTLARLDITPLSPPEIAPNVPSTALPLDIPTLDAPLDANVVAYLWLALHLYLSLGDLVNLPVTPSANLLSQLAQGLSEDQLADLRVMAERVQQQLRDTVDGYTAFPAPLPDVDTAAIRATIARALAESLPLEICYHTAGRGERTTRIVEPLQMQPYGGAEYLVAYCRLRQEERVFRLDRIERAVVIA
jgi:hypothetical protein